AMYLPSSANFSPGECNRVDTRGVGKRGKMEKLGGMLARKNAQSLAQSFPLGCLFIKGSLPSGIRWPQGNDRRGTCRMLCRYQLFWPARFCCSSVMPSPGEKGDLSAPVPGAPPP